MVKSYRKPYRVKKKKSILKSRLFWRIVLGSVLLGVASYFFLLSSIFQVKEINIFGSPAFYGEIQKSIYGKNIFLVDLESIKKEISEKFPKIAAIDIKKRFPDKVIVQVEERRAAAVFCRADACFLIDKEGVIFQNAATSSDLLKIQKAEEAVLTSKIMSSILAAESKLKDISVLTKEYWVVSNERLNIKTSEGWEIYFDPAKDLNWQITKLEAVLEQEISPDRRKSLQYVELRFGNLASYK